MSQISSRVLANPDLDQKNLMGDAKISNNYS